MKYAIAFVLAGSAAFVFAIFFLAPGQAVRALGPASMSLVATVAWVLLSRGRIAIAIHLLVFGLWAAVTGIAFFNGGIRGMAIIVYPQLILILGWLVGTRAAIAMAALAVAATLGLVLAESFNVLPPPPHTPPLMRWIVDSFIFAFSVILIASFVRSYQDRLTQADKLASDLARRSADLNHAQSVAHVGSWVHEIATGVIHSSAETCRIFGMPEGTIGSSDMYIARVHPEDRDTLVSVWQAALKSGEPFDYEHRIVVGKTTRWIRQMAEFELDANRRPLRSVGTTQDITDRKQTEHALRASEARFRGTIEASPIPFAIIDDRQNVTYLNSSFIRTFGYALEDIPTIFDWWPKAYPDPAYRRTLVQKWQTGFETTVRENRVFEPLEVNICCNNGTLRTALISATPVGISAGQLVLVTFFDITERKQAEADLRLAASVFEYAQEAIIVTDALGVIIAANQRLTEITGYAVAEAIGRNPRILKSERQGADFYRGMWAFINTHGYWTGELWNRRKSGDIFPVWLSISAVRDSNGKVTNYVGLFTDISQRVDAEQALRASEEKFAKAFRSSPMFISISTAGDGRYIDVNEGFLRGTGHTREELIGRTSRDIGLWKNPQDRQRAVDSMRKDGRLAAFEAELCKKSGESMICEIWAEPIEIEDKACVIWVTHDATARKKAEMKIRQFNTELEQRVQQRTQELQVANKELEAFSYSVSHDLRAPLRAIHGFSSLMEKQYADQIDGQGLDMLRRIAAGVSKMGLLIDDLLRLSRISRQTMQIAPVDLSAMAWEVVGNLQADAPERRVEWAIAPHVSAECDPGLIRVALQNLIGNAWKYCSKSDAARIEFGVGEWHGKTAYFVRDNGAGFDMAHADRLFGAFQRLHSPGEFPGTGIGLATVKRIIQRHGGEVGADGKVGAGATFHFTL